MANDFGLKVGVDGESEFKKALYAINTSMKTLGTEAKLVESQFDSQDKSVEALTAKNEILNKQLGEQQRKIDLLKDALENAKKKYGENSEQVAAWQQKLNTAQAELNTMQRRVNQNTEAIEQAGKAEEDAAEAAEDYAEKNKEAGKSAEESSGKMKAFGAVLGTLGSALATAAAGVAKVGKALVEMSTGGAAYADTVLTESVVTGIATDKLQEYMYAAELVDVSTDTLTKSMAKNIKSMKSAADGSASYAEAYEALGVAVTDADGNLRNSETVYWELIDALGQIENETERDALAMTVLGKSAQDLNPLITAGADKMAELGAKAREAGYVVGDEMLGVYGNLDDQIQYLTVGCTAAKNALGTVLLPVLTDLAGSGVDLLGDFTNAVLDADGDLGKMAENLGGIIPKAVEAIEQNLPGLLEIITTIFQSVLDLLVAALPSLLAAIETILQQVLETLLQALPDVIKVLFNFLKSVVKTIVQMLPEILRAVIQIVSVIVGELPALFIDLSNVLVSCMPALFDALISMIPVLIATVKQFFVAVIDQLPDLITTIVDILPELLLTVLDAVLEALPLIIECLVELVAKIVERLPDIILAIVDKIPDLVGQIVGGILDELPTLIGAVVQIVVAIAKNLPAIMMTIIRMIPQLIMGIVEAIAGTVGEFLDIGKRIVEGIWEGISGAASWLWDKVSGWASDLVDGVKDFFGIHSPSTVFAGIGTNMGLGLAEGFTDTMEDAEKDIQSAIPREFDISAKARLETVIQDATVGATTKVEMAVPTASAMNEQEELRLMRQQNSLLQQILAKNLNIVIGDEDIGRANSRYEQNRGINLNSGVYANAY